MKKYKLFLVFSAFAISFLSNRVNAMERDEKEGLSKSQAITQVEVFNPLNEDCISIILKHLPSTDFINCALTSTKASQILYNIEFWGVHLRD